MASPGNTKAETVLKWGDGEYLFSLKVPQIEELQRLCGDVSIFAIVRRVCGGDAFLVDIRESVRLGLIGGGMAPVTADQKTKLYVDGQPLDRSGDPSSPYKTAKAVLLVTMFGIDELERDTESDDKALKKNLETNQSTSPGSEPSSSKAASTPTRLPEE